MTIVTNTGLLYTDTVEEALLSADADISIFVNTDIIMRKIPNRTIMYFKGDPIKFIIFIINTSDINMDSLTFQDTMDSAFQPLSGNDFEVTTTSGIVTSVTSNIEITNINIPAGSAVIITIAGVIA